MTDKTIEELKEDKSLLLQAISILDTITEEETGKQRTDDEFGFYESWATSDMKKELTSKIGEIEVQLEYLNESDESTSENDDEEDK